MKLTKTNLLVLKLLTAMILFYIVIFIIWNSTNQTNLPSNYFFDWSREGYQVDPLHDRKK